MSVFPVCSVDGCDMLAIARGWCNRHYARWRRHGDPNYQPPPKPECSVDDCDLTAHARDLCMGHYGHLRRYGNPLGRAPVQCDWNPWTGQVPCPRCGSSEWTLPMDPGADRQGRREQWAEWRCVGCHLTFLPDAAVCAACMNVEHVRCTRRGCACPASIHPQWTAATT